MPWTPEDASRKTKKANTPKKKRQWAHVADSVRERDLAKGMPEKRADADAVIKANGVVKKNSKR